MSNEYEKANEMSVALYVNTCSRTDSLRRKGQAAKDTLQNTPSTQI